MGWSWEGDEEAETWRNGFWEVDAEGEGKGS